MRPRYLFHSLLVVASLIGAAVAGSCSNPNAPPTGLLSKLRAQYKYAIVGYYATDGIFWTPNVESGYVDFAFAVAGATVGDANARSALCGWVTLGYNPGGRGMVGTTGVRGSLFFAAVARRKLFGWRFLNHFIGPLCDIWN